LKKFKLFYKKIAILEAINSCNGGKGVTNYIMGPRAFVAMGVT
jgi:hypothetical protein